MELYKIKAVSKQSNISYYEKQQKKRLLYEVVIKYATFQMMLSFRQAIFFTIFVLILGFLH